jgi:hypothetical protein
MATRTTAKIYPFCLRASAWPCAPALCSLQPCMTQSSRPTRSRTGQPTASHLRRNLADYARPPALPNLFSRIDRGGQHYAQYPTADFRSDGAGTPIRCCPAHDPSLSRSLITHSMIYFLSIRFGEMRDVPFLDLDLGIQGVPSGGVEQNCVTTCRSDNPTDRGTRF